MLPMSSGAIWMGGDEDDAASWTRNNTNNKNEGGEPKNVDDQNCNLGIGGGASFSNFKSLLEGDWYVNNNVLNPNDLLSLNPNNNRHDIITSRDNNIGCFSSNQASENITLSATLQPMDSAAYFSPSRQAFSLDPSPPQNLFPPRSCFSSLLLSTNPFDNGFDLGCDTSGFLSFFQGNQLPSNSSVLMGFTALHSHSHMATTTTTTTTPELSSSADFSATRLLPPPNNAAELDGDSSRTGFEGFDGSASGSGGAQLLNRAKPLRPLQVFPPMPVGAQPTLFQKRAALWQNSGGDQLGNLEISGHRYGGVLESLEKKRKNKEEEGEMEEGSMDVSGLNYDSDEFNEYTNSQVEENVKNGGSNYSNANTGTVTGGVDGGVGDRKGKKKGLPAKNLMAERRRRKKLNDRLYMLRSVVPKISKMDRASILGDAIDYLKELLQRINDLHNELESAPPGSLLPPSASFHPLTPTPSTLPCRVKEELCPSSLPSPKSQSAKVEVRVREGRTLNIHMFCGRRPGLLLSTMRALDNLGLDIQQAVISCFNGFALDVFRAEQCSESHFLPEQIKAVLLDSAGFHDMM